MSSPAVTLTVDGTLMTCKGVIARLEQKFTELPPGALAQVRVNTVPNRIDVRAWADRKGHRVLGEVRRGDLFELLLAKGEGSSRPRAPGAVGAPRSGI